MRWLLPLVLLCLVTGCKKNEPPAPAGPPQPPVTLDGGLTYQILAPGTGDEAKLGQKIAVQYVGKLMDGTEFDRSGDPFVFRLGAGWVIKGWDQGLVGMKEGEVRKLTVPPDLGYGSSGSGPIPPNATLVFDVQLVDVR